MQEGVAATAASAESDCGFRHAARGQRLCPATRPTEMRPARTGRPQRRRPDVSRVRRVGFSVDDRDRSERGVPHGLRYAETSSESANGAGRPEGQRGAVGVQPLPLRHPRPPRRGPPDDGEEHRQRVGDAEREHRNVVHGTNLSSGPRRCPLRYWFGLAVAPVVLWEDVRPNPPAVASATRWARGAVRHGAAQDQNRTGAHGRRRNRTDGATSSKPDNRHPKAGRQGPEPDDAY